MKIKRKYTDKIRIHLWFAFQFTELKVRTFWEAHKIWKKSSSCFVHLPRKHPNYEEDFSQIVCASQKVWTLSPDADLIFDSFFSYNP